MNTKEKILIIILCFLSILLGFLIGKEIYDKSENFDKGYKQGQIDALNGIQHYDKLVSKDAIYFKIK